MQLTFTGNSPSNPQNNNRMDGYTYDAAGNLLNDGSHQYFYDAENRLTQVDGTLSYCSSNGASGTAATACYFYDANGHRVRDTANGGLSGGIGYSYDLSGRWVMCVTTGSGGAGACAQEIYAGSRHLIHAGGTTLYSHSDWLGTERVHTYAPYGSSTWYICESIASLPFGDGQTITGNCYHTGTLHFTGKERDSESGLDNFGARYNSSQFGRFMSPDTTPLGIAPGNPQSWNLYSYTRDNPISAVDVGGKWYTPIHKEMVEIALGGLLSAGEITQLQHRQDVMDSNQDDQTGHFMATPGQDPAEAAHNSFQLIADNMREAAKGVDSEGKMSSSALDHLGDAMHTLQDMTSPMHTAEDGTPLVWYGTFGKFGTNGMRHFMGENDPSNSWSRFGEAIRLTLAAYVQANPIGAAKHGLTADNYVKEANRRISEFVDRYYGLNGRSDPIEQDRARACALGNPAACID